MLRWSQLSDRELLGLSLSQLGLSLDGSPVAQGVSQLYRELARKGLSFRPHFWISDEWFCPDGIPGISVPFFLFHPRLRELERRYIGYVEGGTHEWLMKLLRHETGHAIENAYDLRRGPRRVEVFGDTNTPYPDSYSPLPHSRRYVRHLGDHYAQSHPDEDFAETFAVWMTPGLNWQVKYQGWGALHKLKVMDRIMRSLKSQRQVRTNRFRQDPIERNRQTLGQYYQHKRRKLGLSSTKGMDKNLNSVFYKSGTKGIHDGRAAAAFLTQNRRKITREIALGLGEYQYRVERVVARLSKRAGELGLIVRPHQKLGPVLDVVAAQALEDLERKRHHIVL
ncbi:MAG: putative zinc-binding metallopeptidase [Bdellovibrionales bacterium]|nr:putative zinc-binding metallopeptidase [Bdellovibrionales bacterium]